MKFRFTYKSYQDVRHNTVLYFLPVIYLLSFTFYFFILPISWKVEIDRLISELVSKNYLAKFFIKGISILLIFSIISYLLIEILKVHDHFYDRYVIRWRRYYDRDFILPRLCKPFLNSTNSDRFFEESNNHKSKFMQELYYHFVGDDVEKISNNARVRFYETITIYWFTQMNEFAFIVSFLILNVLAIITKDSRLLNNLPYYLLLLFVLTFINWLWKRSNHQIVEQATVNQINEIHESPVLVQELKDRFINICKSYNIPYNG